MTRRQFPKILALTLASGALSSCGNHAFSHAEQMSVSDAGAIITESKADSSIEKLEDGFSVVRHEGGDGFDAFLAQGGA